MEWLSDLQAAIALVMLPVAAIIAGLLVATLLVIALLAFVSSQFDED